MYVVDLDVDAGRVKERVGVGKRERFSCVQDERICSLKEVVL